MTTAKRSAETFTYTVPEGCHLVNLMNYTGSPKRSPQWDNQIGFHAHLIMKEGWYDDTGASLYGTSISSGYHPDPQSAIDDAYARVLAFVDKINEEIPLRKETTMRASPANVRKEAADLLSLLNL